MDDNRLSYSALFLLGSLLAVMTLLVSTREEKFGPLGAQSTEEEDIFFDLDEIDFDDDELFFDDDFDEDDVDEETEQSSASSAQSSSSLFDPTLLEGTAEQSSSPTTPSLEELLQQLQQEVSETQPSTEARSSSKASSVSVQTTTTPTVFQSSAPSCTDSDGENYYLKGTVDGLLSNGAQDTLTDQCLSGNLAHTLIEYVCGQDGIISGIPFDCPHGCSTGKCIGSPPLQPTQPSYNPPPVPVTSPSVNNVTFIDAPSLTLEGKAAEYLANRNPPIIQGYANGTFGGGRAVTRAEAAKILMIARGEPVPSLQNSGRFWDVVEGEWYVDYVIHAANLDIVTGNPDGSFQPTATINTAEFAKMLSLSFDLPLNQPYSYTDINAGHWFSQYAGALQQQGLLTGRFATFKAGQAMTRGEVAIAIYKLLLSIES